MHLIKPIALSKGVKARGVCGENIHNDRGHDDVLNRVLHNIHCFRSCETPFLITDIITKKGVNAIVELVIFY